MNGVEVEQWVPDAGRRRGLMHRRAGQHGVVLAVGFVALGDVVAPGDSGAVHEVGQVRPGIDRWLGVGMLGHIEVRRIPRVVDRVRAVLRVVVHALRRPLGHREQVSRQTPRRVGFEHVVLQDEVLRVGPVVGDLAPVVIAHHVAPGNRGRTVRRVGVGASAAALRILGLPDKAVHPAVVDVGQRVLVTVRATAVDVAPVVKGTGTVAPVRVGHADVDASALRGEAVSTWERAEIAVE
jgi:hypothetical protein